jgi:hypothetical protein
MNETHILIMFLPSGNIVEILQNNLLDQDYGLLVCGLVNGCQFF